MKILLFLLVVAGGQETSTETSPRNVILFIGDGMGVPQVTLGRLLSGSKPALDELPVTGLVLTHSANRWVTDSAAAATALATGSKTDNFSIGIDPQKRPLETILEKAKKRKKSVGLVTNTKITHATPAAFAAHVTHRSLEGKIARQYLDTDVDVFLGGGRRMFGRDLLRRFRAKGYTVAFTAQELKEAQGKVLGLFSDSHMPYVLDRKGEPGLAEMTRKAVGLLSKNPRGFFLMVEGGRIDQACHASDAPSAAAEMIDFDQAVRAALEFARADGHTLIVVTADHGTGAMAVTEKLQARKASFSRVRASAERIAREMKEETIESLLEKHAGITDPTAREIGAIKNSRAGYDRASWIGEIISRRCGVSFIPMEYRLQPPNTTHGHDGAMVPVYAFGPGADRFSGTLDNTEIPIRIIRLAGY